MVMKRLFLPLLFYFSCTLNLIAQEENSPYYISEKRIDWELFAALRVDFVAHDFSDFEEELGVDNIYLMNLNSGLLALEFGGRVNRWVSAFNFGFSSRSDDNDSISIGFTATQYEFNFGYIVVNSNRFCLTPLLEFKWRRNRLTNSDLNRKIDIDTYLTNRDLDFRINHTYAVIGLDFAYKMYRYNILFSDYWSFGLFTGYRLKINETPWVYSRENRLISSNKINITNFDTSFSVAFHF